MRIEDIKKDRVYRTTQGFRFQVTFLLGGTVSYLVLPGDSAKESSGIEGRTGSCPVKEFASRVCSVERARYPACGVA